MAEPREIQLPVKLNFEPDLQTLEQATAQIDEAAKKLQEFRLALRELSYILSSGGKA